MRIRYLLSSFMWLTLVTPSLGWATPPQASPSEDDTPAKKHVPYGKRLRLRREGYGSLTGGEGIVLFKPHKNTAPAAAQAMAASSVNPLLWRACLETLKFMPFVSSDAVGGVLITDWYTDPKNPRQRFKVTATLRGTDFEPHNLSVQVHSQHQNAQGAWGVTVNDSQVALKLEEVIIQQAKALYAQANTHAEK